MIIVTFLLTNNTIYCFNTKIIQFLVYTIKNEFDVKFNNLKNEFDVKFAQLQGEFNSLKGDFNKLYDIHGTPQLFLLDKDKRIVAKQFSVNQLKMILDEYLRLHRGK